MPATLRHAALLLAALVAACGGSPAPSAEEQGETVAEVLAAVEGLDGAQRTARLLELANDDGGELTVYTAMSPSLLEPVIDAFEEAYDLDVAVYRATSETVLQRLVEELRAGFRGSDAVELSGPEMVALSLEEGLSAYESPATEGVVASAGHETWTTDRVNLFVVARNSELLPDAEAPRTWEELADPRWQGKLAIEVADSDWLKGLWDYWKEQGLSEQEAERLLIEIGANARLVKGHTVLAQLMGAGEFEIGVNYRHTTEGVARDGAPLAYEPSVSPVIARDNGVGISAEPAHPAAAILFVDWLLGPGQDVLLENGADPVRTDLQDELSSEERYTVDIEGFVADEQQWNERFERLLVRGREAEEGS